MTRPARSLAAQVSAVAPPAVAGDAHAVLHGGLHWQVPERMNLADACCTRWAVTQPSRVALQVLHADGTATRWTYAALREAASRLAHALERLGSGPGERVAMVLPQGAEMAVALLGTAQAGAVAMPLSQQFGEDALAFRLQDSGATVALVDAAHLPRLRALRAACPALRHVVVAGPLPADVPALRAEAGEQAWAEALAREPAHHAAVLTRAEDPAVLIYTSGTTGAPKGALIPHRALLGNLSGFVCSQNWLDTESAPGDAAAHVARAPVFWSPADWAWTGGLMDALLPCLALGVPIVANPARFDPLAAFALMQRFEVTHTFLFPTALKAMMKAVPAPHATYRLVLRGLMSAGEAVGDAVFAWCRDALGVTVNEMFGQTEINYVVGNCGAWRDRDGVWHPGWPRKPGSMGRAYPGHRVAVIDEDGRELPPGTPGDVAVHRRDIHGHPDPVFFLGYWKNEAATRAKFTGDPADSWCRTGDTAVMDEDGYLWYQGRSDDVFKSAGYRIGPSEVENCLVKHPAVLNAAVVPKPDADRGALVKAYVVLAEGVRDDAALADELAAFVRARLAPYEAPKEVEFIDALPMTTTGKVQRRVLRLQEAERAKARGVQGG